MSAEAKRRWRLANPEKMDAARKRWRGLNKRRVYAVRNASRRKLWAQNEAFRLQVYLRLKITLWIKRPQSKNGRRSVLERMVGADKQTVRRHLESLFQPGMTWDNHGYWGWHIDHIKPVRNFDLTNPEQQRQFFHYTNMQPLWRKSHFLKHGFVPSHTDNDQQPICEMV